MPWAKCIVSPRSEFDKRDTARGSGDGPSAASFPDLEDGISCGGVAPVFAEKEKPLGPSHTGHRHGAVWGRRGTARRKRQQQIEQFGRHQDSIQGS
jgi:hypothetical protein